MYDIERYYQAKDVEDAVNALASDEKAMIVSGGTDVLVQIREGRHAGASLVSIHGIEELEGIYMEEDGTIVIGAATVFSHITRHPCIVSHIPMLGEAVDQAGGPQLRNAGTIGGNVCNGVTSADSAPSLMVLNAVIELRGVDGTRRVPIREFYTGPGKTVRKHDEVAVAIRIGKEDYDGFSGHYIKYGKRNAMEIATLGCAVNVKLITDHLSDSIHGDPLSGSHLGDILPGEGRRIADLRIAYGVAAPTPVRCPETEAKAIGMAVSEELFDMIGKSVLAEVSPRSSWRASQEFRLHLVEELVKRALRSACVQI